MKIMYFLRVLLVSVEALVLCIAGLTWSYFWPELGHLAATIALDEEILKYLMLVPFGLAVWVASELRPLLQEDKGTTRILVAWPEYWKLKLHLWVSLLYAVVFVCLSIAPWAARTGISTGMGFLLFVTSIIGQISLAASVYAARLRMKEVLANTPEV